jgi:hypothetical protein
MADGMTEEEIEACRLAFEKFDADGSGTIEANELNNQLAVAVFAANVHQNSTSALECFQLLKRKKKVVKVQYSRKCRLIDDTVHFTVSTALAR